jgi:hypothetical protein
MKEVMKSIGLEGCREVDLQGCRHVQRLVASCNPSINFEAEADFVMFWEDIRDALEGVGGTV